MIPHKYLAGLAVPFFALNNVDEAYNIRIRVHTPYQKTRGLLELQVSIESLVM